MRDDLAKNLMYVKGLYNKFIVEVKKDGKIEIMRFEWASYMFTKEVADFMLNCKENEWTNIPEQYIEDNLLKVQPLRIYKVNEDLEYVLKIISSLFSQYTTVIVYDKIPENDDYECIIEDKLYYTRYGSTDNLTSFIINKDLSIAEFANIIQAIIDLSIKYNKFKERFMKITGERIRRSIITEELNKK